MPWRIVTDSEAREVFRYPTTFPEEFTSQYPLDMYMHLYVENLVDPDSLRPAKSEDGSVVLVPNIEWYWSQLRAERNRRLAASDWVALADAHMSQDRKDAWFVYRQELRDLPETVQDPTQVTWPLDPTQQPPIPVTGSRLDNILNQA